MPVPVPASTTRLIAGFDGFRHLPGHFVLAGPALAPHPGDGTVEHVNDEQLAGRFGNLHCHQVSHC
ncbi:MAG: hypothetical protein PVSMB10_00270 [Pseudarthrobacter sp.]